MLASTTPSTMLSLILRTALAAVFLSACTAGANPDAAQNGLTAASVGADADAAIQLPRRLMLGTEVLNEIHLQTGASYAFLAGGLARQIDTTPFDGKATIAQLAARLAPRWRVVKGTLLLEADLSEEQLKALADQLASPDVDTRRTAAYLLGNTASTRAIAPLAGALTDKDESVRHHALRSLDRLERDFRPVMGNDHPTPFVRPNYRPTGRVSVFAIVRDLPADRLVALLKGAPDAATNQWMWAAALLGRVDDSAAGDELARGRRHGYATSRTIADFLTGLEPFDPGDEGDRRDSYGAGRMIVRLGNDDPALRVETIRLIARRNDIGASRLLRSYASELDSNVRAEILLALGRKGGPEAWDLLLKSTESANDLIRRCALRGLERCPDPKVIPRLVEVLTGEGSVGDDRERAAMALGMIGSAEAVKALSDYVNQAKQPISTTAIALGWSGRPEAVPALAKCLKIDSVTLHMLTYTALWQIGTGEAVKAMLTTYNEYDNTARYQGHAAVRLAAHNQDGLDYLVDWVNKGTSRITVHGLEMAEDPRAVDALLATIPKSKGDRLQFAVQALGRIGDPKAVPLLVKLLNHEDAGIAYDAMRGLRWRWNFWRKDVRDALAAHDTFKALVEPIPSPADQKPGTWVLRNWPIDLDDYRAVNTSYEAGMTFDESTGLVTKVNAHGQRCDTPQLGETWLFDSAANAWRESKAPVLPFGMCGSWGITYDRSAQRVVFTEAEGAHHGWQWDRGRAMRANSHWVYDGVKERWTPMNPLQRIAGPGMRGFQPLVYHDGANVVFLHGGEWGGNVPNAARGRAWTYDTWTNTWTMLPESANALAPSTHDAICYVPDIDKVMIAGRKDRKTWLFDLKTNAWTDAQAKGDPPAFRLPMQYDPVGRKVLAFMAHDSHGTRIWQYDPKANTWSKLDDPAGMNPHHDSVDCVYDSRNGVFVLDGGHLGWNTDHLAVREAWTYKPVNGGDAGAAAPKKVQHKRPPLVEGVAVGVLRDGTVKVTWEKSAADVAGYHVFAADVAVGERMHPRDLFTKMSEWRRLTDKPLAAAELLDARPLGSADGLFSHDVRAYYVTAVDAAGVESGPSATVVSLTSSVPGVAAEELPDGTTKITWQAVPEAGVIGYAVYRMDLVRTNIPFRLNPQPVTGTEFVDRCESPRAERRRYYVVAIDGLGQEGMPSTGAWAFGRP